MSTAYKLSTPEQQQKIDEAILNLGDKMQLSAYDQECLKYLFGMRDTLPPRPCSTDQTGAKS